MTNSTQKSNSSRNPPTRNEQIQLLALLEEKQRRRDREKFKQRFETLYHWQHKFIEATASNTACMLMAANRVGKTLTGLTIDAAHLLGDYPDDWKGHKFDFAPMLWLLGYSMEKTRDLLQNVLFGVYANGVWSGGLVPADRIVGYLSASGTTGAMRQVTVRHATGGTATVQFWSYSQGQHAIMGDTVDWYHIDEEPRDKAIFPQVLTRTATGDRGRGGRGILTFTPENGRTELVVQFMDAANEGQYLQRATWDDAPHLTEQTKRTLLAMYPEWQRAMRTRGEPLLGSGLIFDMADSVFSCQAFEIPDHWYLINGMDYGWNHPQAHIQLAWDKDADIIYVTQAWKKSNTVPELAWTMVKPWANGVITAWPHDGHQHDKGSGKALSETYKAAGWKMCNDMASWPTGGNSVEAGLVELYSRMEKGTFKVFSHLTPWFEEKMNYHRKEDGTIVKVNDDILSATRYAYMMRRFAVQKGKVGAVVDIKPRIVQGPTPGGTSWMG